MKIHVLTLMLLTAFSCYSQNETAVAMKPIEPSRFSLGLTAGFGHSFMEPYRNYAFNASGNFGVSAIYSPWAHWGIGADITHSAEGFTLKSGDLTYNAQLDYVRIPIRAIYFFNTYASNFRPKIMLGPTLGFLTSQVDNSAAANFDMGLTTSVGFNYRLGRAVWLNADISYYQGLLDIYTANSSTDLNGNLRLNVGMSFGF